MKMTRVKRIVKVEWMILNKINLAVNIACSTVGARDLTFLDFVHQLLCVTYRMSCVMCHVSYITWYHNSQIVRARDLKF